MVVNFNELMQKNFWTYLLLGFALLACLWTLGHTRDYINDCNEHWEEQVEIIKEECKCYGNTDPFIFDDLEMDLEFIERSLG